MNKDDFIRLEAKIFRKLGVTGGWITKIDGSGVYLYITWGALKKLLEAEP